MKTRYFYAIMCALFAIICGLASINLLLYAWLPRLEEAIYMVYVRLL